MKSIDIILGGVFFENQYQNKHVDICLGVVIIETCKE